jgi:serine/threonine protein phosphatase PrpC
MEYQLPNMIDNLSKLLTVHLQLPYTQNEKRIPFKDSSIIICSKKGSVRQINQDRVAVVEINNQMYTGACLIVAILADGMGGMSNGDKAASTAIGSFISYMALGKADIGLKKLSEDAVLFANKKVYDEFQGKGGATLSAITFGSKGCVAVNVGDSRIYSFEKESHIKQITKDDTIAGQILRENEEENAWFSPSVMDNRLAQHVGVGEGILPHSFDLTTLNSNSCQNSGLLITSDGAHYIGKVMMQKIIDNVTCLDDIASRIVSVSEYLSGHDNLSTISISPKIVFSSKSNRSSVEVVLHALTGEFTFIIPLSGEQKFKDEIVQQKLFDSSKHKPDVDATVESKRKATKPKGKKQLQNKKNNFVKKTRPKKEGDDVVSKIETKVDIITVNKGES